MQNVIQISDEELETMLKEAARKKEVMDMMDSYQINCCKTLQSVIELDIYGIKIDDAGICVHGGIPIVLNFCPFCGKELP